VLQAHHFGALFLFSVTRITAPMNEFPTVRVHEMSAEKNSFVRAASGDYSAASLARRRERPTSAASRKISEYTNGVVV
jgi:hypothetical protein